MFNILGAAFSWLTGNSKSADKAMSAVDALIFTDEEKSNVDTATREKVLDFKIRYAEATQGQSVARRVIAFSVTAMWVLLSLTIVIAAFFDNGEDSFADFVTEFMVENINTPFSIVLGFYFLAHVVGKIGK